MSTVEAIQANLIGLGMILYPASPENPPAYIDDLTIYILAPRVFEKANPNGPVFNYTRDVSGNKWVLEKE